MADIKILKDKIRQEVIAGYSNLFLKEAVEEKELRRIIGGILEEIIHREHISLQEPLDKERIINEIVNDFIGLGPIESLIKDPTVTEIMINGPKTIYVERDGKKALSNIAFDNERQLMTVIYRILSPTRRRVDESYPYTEVSLKDGSRINIIIPPLALNGPTVTIRKFMREIKQAEDLINLGTLDNRMGDFLVACIKAKINIVFSGPTGAGKTTTLNVLSSYIANDQRIITIEDTAELVLTQDHVVRLEARQPNIEGKGEVTIRELFRNSLRMRPDRIIIGEIRGNEALDMLQAICSGHGGSLAVIHAESPQDVVYRLETMILTSGVPITLEAIHRQIAAAINIIVQQARLPDGSRKITQITQVNGLKDGHVNLGDIFIFDQEGIAQDGRVAGRWRATGVIPVFYPLLKKAGIKLPQEIFNKD